MLQDAYTPTPARDTLMGRAVPGTLAWEPAAPLSTGEFCANPGSSCHTDSQANCPSTMQGTRSPLSGSALCWGRGQGQGGVSTDRPPSLYLPELKVYGHHLHHHTLTDNCPRTSCAQRLRGLSSPAPEWGDGLPGCCPMPVALFQEGTHHDTSHPELEFISSLKTPNYQL